MGNQDKCDFIYPSGEQCFRLRESGSERCICHLNDENKDGEKFWNEVRVMKENATESINFSGFFFPRISGDFFYKNKFLYDVSFEDAHFLENVGIDKCDFKGSVNFKNVYFAGSALIWSVFEREVTFENATFMKGINFEGNAAFKEFVNFRGATFHTGDGAGEEIIMQSGIFQKSCSFKDATFPKGFEPPLCLEKSYSK